MRCVRPASPRIQQRQAARIKVELARAHGERFGLGGVVLHAFPLPQRLLALTEAQGLNAEKLSRLHGVAEASLSGVLDADVLRSFAPDDALERLRTLPGIGAWSSGHILLRGAGLADELPLADPRSRDAVQLAYDLSAPPDDAEFQRIAEAWRPYRTWAVVLLRTWFARQRSASYRQRAEDDRRLLRLRRLETETEFL